VAKRLAALVVLHKGRLVDPAVAYLLFALSEAAERLVSPCLLQQARASAEPGPALAALPVLEKAARDLAKVSGSPSFLDYPE
jgi:hypothetical protein